MYMYMWERYEWYNVMLYLLCLQGLHICLERENREHGSCEFEILLTLNLKYTHALLATTPAHVH